MERIRWSVDQVDPGPNERIMEIGCGGGTAAALVCARLGADSAWGTGSGAGSGASLDSGPGAGPGLGSGPGSGSLVAIDRSMTAVRRTLARNAACVAAGRLTVLQAPFTFDGVGELGEFDKIFSINVNLFWTSPAREELTLLRRLLVPGGTMFACWGRGPTPGRSDEIAARTAARFTDAGFQTSVISSAGLQCVRAMSV